MADEIDDLMNADPVDLEQIAQELCDAVNLKIMEFSQMEAMTKGRLEAKKLYHELVETYDLTEADQDRVGVIFAGMMRRAAAEKMFGKAANGKIARTTMKAIEKRLKKTFKGD